MASAPNPFDEFDRHLEGKHAESAPPEVNPFDEFDAEPSPIERGLATQEAKDALAEAQAQSAYEQRQRQIAEMDAKYPEWRPNPLVVDAPPAVDPHLEYRKADLPPSPAQKLGTQFKMGLLENENTQRQVMARALFPDLPLEEGMKRVGFYDGNAVYIDNNGELQQLSSGMTRFLANMAANSPETAGSIVGGIGGGIAAGPVGAAGGSAAGAATAHGLKRAIAGYIFDEPFDPISIGKGMAREGALGLVGEVPGGVIAGVANRPALFNMTAQELRAARDVQARIKAKTDIDLDLPQASGNRKFISARNYLARHPGESADIFEAQDERALGQLHNFQDKVLDSIASAKPAEIAEAGGVNAADAALRSARREVSNKVRPLYTKAYEANPVVTDPEVLKFLKLPYFPEAYQAGQTIAKLEEKEAPTIMAQTVKETREKHPSGAFRVTRREIQDAPVSQPDLRSLDYLKQGLDNVIESLTKSGQGKLAGALTQQKKAFVAALDNLGSPEYQAARQAYGKLYDARIAPLENGPVGILAKLKDQDAVGAAAKIFGDADVTPTQIAFARKAITAEPGGQEAWNDLTRAWLANAFNKARTESEAGVELNPAGKSRKALYGNARLRAKMDEILPSGATDMFQDLMEASQKLSRTKLAGSNTPVDTAFRETLKGRALPVFKWLTTFRKKAIDAAEERAIEKGTKEVAQAMTDPTKFKHMQRVLRMKPSTERAILLSTIISARTGAEALRSQSDNVDEDTPLNEGAENLEFTP